jgi:hypothetical protein
MPPPPQFFDFTFWQNFVSNSLATLLGIIIGIPVALWINSWQERKTEKEHKRKILYLLYGELITNHEVLTKWWGDEGKRVLGVMPALLHFELWSSFSDGGELQWIKDPDLLNWISDAYYSIKSVMYLSEKNLDILYISNDAISGWSHKEFLDKLDNAVADAQENIEEALGKIKETIGDPNLTPTNNG